jgi:hypothetical protein
MAELQNSPVEFAIPEDIENWVKLWEGRKLKGKTLSSLENLSSG